MSEQTAQDRGDLEATGRRKGNPAWVKGGPSPNPNGRPKTGETWSEILKRLGAEPYPGGRDGITRKERLALAAYEAAAKGDAAARQWVADRDEGKLTDRLQVDARHTVVLPPGIPAHVVEILLSQGIEVRPVWNDEEDPAHEVYERHRRQTPDRERLAEPPDVTARERQELEAHYAEFARGPSPEDEG